jgi:hypothetical protein
VSRIRLRGIHDFHRGRDDCSVAPVSMKILIERKQAVRLQISKDMTQPVFNAIDGVEEIAAINVQASSTELPVSAEKEMVFEDLVVKTAQGPAANETEIGDILFILAPPRQPSLTS